ncbi:CxxC motif protein [Haloarcula virus Hardyhisp2]|uniref:CxxC motif protein n=1 Tax=Haloarcula virus Hardyhisp2 TaxID=2811386 RepID=A0A898KC78_9VIRU|nr:CxxC motif protein [Haloarcula virus Hardyhisp2]QSJ05041.1 CxxC motif protein [Haloarcula virus Hardyhisp2]
MKCEQCEGDTMHCKNPECENYTTTAAVYCCNGCMTEHTEKQHRKVW